MHPQYLMKATARARALYLVLVTVGHAHGLSYYADRTLACLLSLHEVSRMSSFSISAGAFMLQRGRVADDAERP